MTALLTAAADTLAAALNIPNGYVFLLFGFILGAPLGWIVGRQRPALDAPPPSSAVAAETPAPAATGISLVINGHNVEVDAPVMATVQSLIGDGDKLNAIKHLREATGLNHAAAKAVVDSLQKVRH